MPAPSKLVLENVQILFRNFAGKESQFNAAGNRNFCVLLSPEEADAMGRDGWNVKFLKAREEGDIPQAYLQVTVSYKKRPPKIVLVTSKGKNILDEELIESVDWADIKQADVTLNASRWEVNGKRGIKAYLQTLYVVIEEDPLDLKYAHLVEINELESGQLAIESGEEWVEGEVLAEESGQLEIESGPPF